MVAIVVHGGAINPLDEKFNEGVSGAAKLGLDILKDGGSAIDAVTEAIKHMEDNPIFNAGTGSWPNLAGEIEMDAIIMDGYSKAVGAVAAIRRVRNPILVARRVMEETDHVLLVGEGALRFARALGFEDYDPLTEERARMWNDLREKLKRGEDVPLTRYWSKIARFAADTVGAVALDRYGRIAAGTSSGGFPMKLPGRVGDVPLVNCSTYASSVCGVSMTGHGEVIMKGMVARRIHDKVSEGEGAQRALELVIEEVLLGVEGREDILLGGIVLDRAGNVGVARNTDLMPHAYGSDVEKDIIVGFGARLKI